MALSAPVVVGLQGAANAAACGVWAGTPFAVSSLNEVGGQGGRSGCSTSKQMTVQLKWDRPLSPDPSLDSKSGSYTNVTLTVSGNCLAGTHDYYVAVSGDGGSASSDPRKRITGTNC